SRAAGTEHGQEFPPERMEALIQGIGRVAQQRTTEYRTVGNERQAASYNAPALAPVVQTKLRKRVAVE
ncbi:MAG: hypothetical protein IT555_05445, partial [Acetobacteraceae bacterium]|nr:hypothetical protein [Acetobacteraceae bacterium]